MKKKHRRDKNHGKQGWVGGNPRYRGNGNFKPDRAKIKRQSIKDQDQ